MTNTIDVTTPVNANIEHTRKQSVAVVLEEELDLSPTEEAFLDGAVLGVQTAGKVVVADANVNTGISKVTALHIGTSGSETQVTATAAELNYNAITAAGTGQASKAVVLDANGNFKMADGDFFQVSADTLSAAGSNSSNAAALIDQITVVTGADGATGVVMAAAADLGEYTVINYSNIYALKIYPVDSGDDVINDLQSDEAFILAPGHMVTLKAISATQWYAPKSASAPSASMRFVIEDDFLDAGVDTTNKWLSFKGTTGATQVATVVTSPEGTITMKSGAANDAQDKCVMSLLLIEKGAVVNLGLTVVEFRVAFNAITGMSWGFGLGDVLANDTEIANYAISAATVTDDAGITDALSFVFDTDADDIYWQICSTNGGTVGAAGAAESTGVVPAVNTYQTLRFEIEPSGDARAYINGVLVSTRALAVDPTALLIPYIWGDSGVTAQSVITGTIDRIRFEGSRPASNA